MSLNFYNLEMDSGILNLVVLTVALPLLTAFLLPVIARVSNRLARITGPVILLLGLLIAALVWGELATPYSLAIGGFSPPLGIVFYLDQVSMLFVLLSLLLALVLWPVSRFQAGQGENNEQSIRIASLTLLLAAAACGIALSGDLFNLYVFYELASVASFGLVAAGQSRAVSLATVRYVILSGLGTVMALTGIALVYTQTGTLNLAHLSHLAPEHLNNPLGVVAFVLILLGVGVKGELFPVNSWVPEVYATASNRVSALLAGLISKLAVLIIVRLLVLVFPFEQAMLIMLLLGLLGVISGELAAWRSRDMKRMLAFSSIGQLGIIFIAFSIPGEAGVFAGLAVALHHLLVKPALFLLAEQFPGSLDKLSGTTLNSDRTSKLGSKQDSMPGSKLSAGLAGGLFVLLALSLIGVPPLPGFWAKLLVVTGLMNQPHTLYLVALGVILLATVIEANYFLRVILGLYRNNPGRQGSVRNGRTEADADKQTGNIMVQGLRAIAGGMAGGIERNFIVALSLGGLLLVSTFYIAPIGRFLEHSAGQLADSRLYKATVFSGGIRLTGEEIPNPGGSQEAESIRANTVLTESTSSAGRSSFYEEVSSHPFDGVSVLNPLTSSEPGLVFFSNASTNTDYSAGADRP